MVHAARFALFLSVESPAAMEAATRLICNPPLHSTTVSHGRSWSNGAPGPQPLLSLSRHFLTTRAAAQLVREQMRQGDWRARTPHTPYGRGPHRSGSRCLRAGGECQGRLLGRGAILSGVDADECVDRDRPRTRGAGAVARPSC